MFISVEAISYSISVAMGLDSRGCLCMYVRWTDEKGEFIGSTVSLGEGSQTGNRYHFRTECIYTTTLFILCYSRTASEDGVSYT